MTRRAGWRIEHAVSWPGDGGGRVRYVHHEHSRDRGMRGALFAIDAFVGLTAVGGGVALAAGFEGDRFPPDLLQGTPFSGYVVPGVILAGGVGGSATVAAAAMLRGSRQGALASVLAGAVLIGWLIGERLILPSRAFSRQGWWVEGIYSAAGAIMSGLGIAVLRADRKSFSR